MFQQWVEGETTTFRQATNPSGPAADSTISSPPSSPSRPFSAQRRLKRPGSDQPYHWNGPAVSGSSRNRSSRARSSSRAGRSTTASSLIRSH